MSFATESITEFIKLFETVKHKIAAFEGCNGVKLLTDINKPNIYFTYSNWDSEEHLNNYRQSELFNDTWTKTKIHFNGKPEAWSVRERE